MYHAPDFRRWGVDFNGGVDHCVGLMECERKVEDGYTVFGRVGYSISKYARARALVRLYYCIEI